jgi:hypothetical protein
VANILLMRQLLFLSRWVLVGWSAIGNLTGSFRVDAYRAESVSVIAQTRVRTSLPLLVCSFGRWAVLKDSNVASLLPLLTALEEGGTCPQVVVN